MKEQNWNGNNIRFVDVNGEWWAVAKDVATALGYAQTQNMLKHVPKQYLISSILHGMNAKNVLISEFGIYKAVFSSHKPDAEAFQEWVFNVIKELRQSAGLEVFELLDKEHQKQAMHRLSSALKQPDRADMIKANTIANKAVSNKHGYPKMVKKGDMTPDVLKDREAILNDTVELMVLKDKYNLNLSVSQIIYDQVGGNANQTA
ncbi:BRO family protein [Latilactobacillus sakei subsp. sakei]|uniref:BRO-N domain-containing protein n=1 Tax=Latilactobacillus sakei TaxID=1599 RepID=UPI00285E97F2|nr:BRO family protein [Latilactobacillus sakei]MDR7925238.1 BRO family protein [Latilactobacillus sakei subsp. sakei]